MPTPHKHAKVIKAWADGKTIQMKTFSGKWKDLGLLNPAFDSEEYRIKPEPQVIECFIHKDYGRFIYENPHLLPEYKRCTITIHPDE